MPVVNRIDSNAIWYRQFDKSTLFFRGEIKQGQDGIEHRSKPLNYQRTKADRKWKPCGCIIRGDMITIRYCGLPAHHVSRSLSGKEVRNGGGHESA